MNLKHDDESHLFYQKVLKVTIFAFVIYIIGGYMGWLTAKNRIVNFQTEPEISWCKNALDVNSIHKKDEP